MSKKAHAIHQDVQLTTRPPVEKVDARLWRKEKKETRVFELHDDNNYLQKENLRKNGANHRVNAKGESWEARLVEAAALAFSSAATVFLIILILMKGICCFI